MMRILLFILALGFSMNQGFSQEKKALTLEDVMPGGSNFYNLQAENAYYTWWGEKLVKLGVDEMSTVNLQNGNTTPFLQIDPVKTALKDQNLGYVGHFLSTSFLKGQDKILLHTRQAYVVYDVKNKAIDKVVKIPEGAEIQDLEQNQLNLAYTKGRNLFVSWHGEETQITDVPEGTVCGTSVHRDEFGINGGIFWSPKGNLLAFYKMDQSMVTDYPQVDITTRIATVAPDKYPMAGTTSHKVYVGVYNPQTKATIWLKTADPTDRYFTNVSWSPDEKSIFVFELNRGQDHLELIQYDAVTGEKMATLYEETHPRYVEPQNPLTFLPWDGNKCIMQTQRDGYNHLYLLDVTKSQNGEWKDCTAGGKCKENVKTTQLTKGNWLVKSIVGFNAQSKQLVGTGTMVNGLCTTGFVVNVNDGKFTAIGTQEGTHRLQLSESGKQVIDAYTSHSVPRRIETYATTGKGKVNTLLDAENPMDAYNHPEVTLGTIKAADGKTDLYYRLIKPLNFDPQKKYPAVIYVYGGPHAQLITDVQNYGAGGWDMYMAQEGYVMLTVDGRGSSNRGLEFENVIHRQLGTEEMKDQMEGVKLLKSLGYVDENRIGVHGWSFGGFMTTNLMLTHNDTFKVGVAGGPVIDWKYYEIMYGERYMDTPQENAAGYDKANLTKRAGDLKGRLEVIIGGNDPICVPQHSLSFLRACEDAGTQPDFFIYPGDEHNMFGRDRVHLYTRITCYFKDFL